MFIRHLLAPDAYLFTCHLQSPTIRNKKQADEKRNESEPTPDRHRTRGWVSSLAAPSGTGTSEWEPERGETCWAGLVTGSCLCQKLCFGLLRAAELFDLATSASSPSIYKGNERESVISTFFFLALTYFGHSNAGFVTPRVPLRQAVEVGSSMPATRYGLVIY